MRKLFSLLPVVLCLAAVTGCSKIRFAYRWADTAIVSKADGYFDLTSEQKDRTAKLVRAALRDVLRDEVPNFNSLLKAFTQLIQDRDLSKEKYLGLYSDTGKFLLGLGSRMEPPFTEFLLMLSPKQFEHYDRKVLEEEKEANEKLGTPEGRKKASKKSTEAWFDFIGLSLTKDQRKLLEEQVEQNPFPYELRGSNEGRLHQLFMKATTSPESLKSYLHQAFQEPLKLREPAFKLAFEKYEESSNEYHWRLYRSLNEEQRAAVVEKLADWVRQLEELRIAEGVSAPTPTAEKK